MQNPIRERAFRVLAYGVDARERVDRGEPFDVPREQAIAKRLLGGFDPRQADEAELFGDLISGTSNHDTFLGIRYLLTCFLDELLLADPLQPEWNESKLETALYGTNVREKKFYDQMRIADAPDATLALEVGLLCVRLGFRGKFRDRPDELNAWVQNTRARLDESGPKKPPRRANDPPAAPLPKLRGTHGWFWRRVVGPNAPAAFHDRDAAWDDAKRALRLEDIDPTSVPVFFLIGEPEGPEAAFVRAGFPHDPTHVRVHPTADDGAPFKIIGTRDALYIVCPGQLRLQSRYLSGTEVEDSEFRPVHERMRPRVYATTNGFDAADDVEPRSGETDRVPRPRPVRRPPREKEALVANAYSELRRLCELLVRDRACPINGVIVRLPFAATATDRDLEQTAACVRADLRLIRETVRLDVPVFAVACDLHQLPGSREFFDRLSEDMLRPVREVLPVGRGTAQMGTALDEVFADLFAHGLRWKTETTPDERGHALAHNRRLFVFWMRLRERRDRLAALFAACAPESDVRGLRGIYFAATGANRGQQAHVAGVLQKTFEYRKHVDWTADALEQDRQRRLWAWLAGTAAGALAGTVAALAWLALA